MKRRLIQALLLSSTIFLIASLTLWIQSYRSAYTKSEGRFRFTDENGMIFLSVLRHPKKIVELEETGDAFDPEILFELTASSHRFLTVSWDTFEAYDLITPGFALITVVGVPCWMLTAVFAIPPVIAAGRWAYKSRQTPAGQCPICGYDLRATPQRCPECGTAQPSN